MDWIKSQFTLATLRNLAQFIGSATVTWGWLDKDQATMFTGILVSLVTFGASLLAAHSARQNATVTKAVAASSPETKADVVNSAPTPAKRTTIVDALEKAFGKK